MVSEDIVEITPVPDDYRVYKVDIRLVQTCRQIYNKARPFFYRNTCQIPYISKSLHPVIPILREQLVNVSFRWNHSLGNILFSSSWLVVQLSRLWLSSWQMTARTRHHSTWSLLLGSYAKTLRRLPSLKMSNFDRLVSIRGLKLVKVEAGNARLGVVTAAQIQDFADFLKEVLLQPRDAIPIGSFW